MSANLYRIAGVAVACALAAPANAQLINQKNLSASMALTMAQTAMDTCKTNGYAVSVTVVGRNGEVLVQVRGDGTGPHTMENSMLENSMRKAYTSRTFRIKYLEAIYKAIGKKKGVLHWNGEQILDWYLKR